MIAGAEVLNGGSGEAGGLSPSLLIMILVAGGLSPLTIGSLTRGWWPTIIGRLVADGLTFLGLVTSNTLSSSGIAVLLAAALPAMAGLDYGRERMVIKAGAADQETVHARDIQKALDDVRHGAAAV